MFPAELAHRLIELPDIADILLRALALKMNDRSVGQVIIRIPSLFDPVTEVDVFSVHEKALVEPADLPEDVATGPQTGAGEYRRGGGSIRGEMTQVISRKDPAS